jgi:hypothetical protein
MLLFCYFILSDVIEVLIYEQTPTVCVTGAGAGVDSVWDQRKPEARKMLENARECPRPVCALLGGIFHHCGNNQC